MVMDIQTGLLESLKCVENVEQAQKSGFGREKIGIRLSLTGLTILDMIAEKAS